MRASTSSRFLLLTAFLLSPVSCQPADAIDDTSAAADDYIEGVLEGIAAEPHADVQTMLVVTWKQLAAASRVHVEFTFENNEWQQSPGRPADPGDNSALILGIPAQTEVSYRVVATVEGVEMASALQTAHTGELPKRVPSFTVFDYDPAAASSSNWLLASVAGSNWPVDEYLGASWVLLLDRQGRVVWHQRDSGGDPVHSFPRVSNDGTRLTFEYKEVTDTGAVSELWWVTLDYMHERKRILPWLSDSYVETDRDTVIYNSRNISGMGQYDLRELDSLGSVRKIWDCDAWAKENGAQDDLLDYCYSNTVHLDVVSDTVLLSMPYIDTIVRIDRESGELLSTWGPLSKDWTFDPPTSGLRFNHAPSITAAGTLLVSTHVADHGDTEVPGEHRIVEFEIDEQAKALREVWSYGEGGPDWPAYRGMAERLDNGNTLMNYGTGGTIREVTPAGESAWYLASDPVSTSEDWPVLVEHTEFVDDLYALTRGG